MRYVNALVIFLVLLLGVIFTCPASPESPRRGEGIRESQTIEPSEIIELLEQQLQKTIQLRYDGLEVKDLRGIDKVIVPCGLFSCEVILPGRIGRGGLFPATLVFSVDGREFKRVKITARVDLYADVVAAKRYLQRHHEIEEKDVQIVRRNLTSLPPDVLADTKDVVSMRTTSSINSQEVLRKSLIQPPPLVRKGERIMMLVENDRFRIVTWGELKDDGRKGEQVKIVNLSSRKEVIGRVLSSGAVMIEY
jgi:flagellar basal body P-ring formation protein FlgA